VRDGGVIAAGHDAELDELRAIGRGSDAYLLELEAKERQRSGIANCASSSTGCTASSSRSRRRRRTTCRPTTGAADDEERRALHHPELKAFEDKGALRGRARAGAREASLRRAARRLAAELEPLSAVARAAGDARRARRARRCAKRSGWCRPHFVREPCIEIERGRHPVVEARLAERGQPFMPERLPPRREAAACSSSPARTWAARAPSCARWR
jgi:DNA mismatch repair protein MutS